MDQTSLNSNPVEWTVQDIGAYTKTLVEKHESQALRYLCFIFRGIKTAGKNDAFCHALMEHGCKSLVKEYWSKRDYATALWKWCDSSLDAALLPVVEKTRILQGKGCTVAAVELYGLLKEYPDVWERMDLSWVGPKSSELRQAATALGWKSESALEAVATFSKLPNDGWLDSFRYPYSLSALAYLQYISRYGYNGFSFHDPEEEGDIVEYGPLGEVRCSIHADPRDVALANVLVQCIEKLDDFEQSSYPRKFVGHPSSAQLAPDKLAEISSLIQLYESFDQMERCTQSLLDDVFPGENPEWSLVLPILD